MAVAYKASGTFAFSTGTITPPYPSGSNAPVAGDIALLVVSSENQAISLTTANGFVELGDQANKNAGSAGVNPASRLAVYWKRCVGGDSAPLVADSGDNTSGQIHLFSGCKTTGNPWDVYAEGNDSGANDTSGSIPGATTTVADTLVVLITSNSRNATSSTSLSGWTNSNLTITERADNTNTAGLGSGHGIATAPWASIGDYGASTVTFAATTYKGTMSIALAAATETKQSGFRFYDDGAESSSTALDSENTDITVDTSSGDVDLGLRIRIDETGGVSGPSTDDYKLQYNLNSGGWTDLGTAITGYASASLTNDGATTQRLTDSGVVPVSDNFNDNAIDTAIWTNWGGANVTESSNTLRINSGTANGDAYGVDTQWVGNLSNGYAQIQVVDDGTARANGQVIPVQVTLSSGNALYWYIENGTAYCMKAVASTYTNVGSTRTHTDNDYYRVLNYAGTTYWQYSTDGIVWTTQHSESTPIAVTSVYVSVLTYNAAAVTATTSVFDNFKISTSVFIPGEISEDGLVDNLAITANNFTELLYSITVVASEVADTDTIDFRVVRNGSALETYTQTPTITIEETAGGYSGTPGIATLTTTLYTPTVTATNNIDITTASPTALTITAQTPTSKLDNRITPDIATLTLTAQTPTVTATNNYDITTASPTALTLTAQTPSVVGTDNKEITFASPTALTTTQYEPTVTVSANQTVTPDTASLTTTTHAIGVAVSDNQAVTPGTDSLTTTLYEPTVSFTDNKTITTASPTNLTLTLNTPTVDATDNKAITLASPSSLALTAQSPTVEVTANVSVTPGTASLTTTNWSPTVDFTANQAITTAGPTNLTLTAQTPTVSATDNKAITLASPTALTLTPNTPTVTATNNIDITTASPTELVTTAHAPGVAVSSSSSITPGTASLTLTLQTPTVEVTNNIAVTPETASLTLSLQTPVVAVTDNKFVTPGIATLTLTPNTPTVSVDSGPIEITPGVAEMLTAMFAPSVTISDNITVTPSIARLRLKTSYPIVNGQVRERDYYIDSNANIYWVINQDIGLVEKI